LVAKGLVVAEHVGERIAGVELDDLAVGAGAFDGAWKRQPARDRPCLFDR
jgi:hypothetical protein